jgi:hypothetical protein
MFSDVAYLNMVLIPTIYTVIFLAFVFRRKMRKETPEFKAVQYMMLAFSVMSEIIIIVMGATDPILQNNTLIQAALFSIGFFVMVYGVEFTLKVIINQRLKIEGQTHMLTNLIKASSDIAVNVSNNATELAASAAEVNASAEEIAATTMEVTLRTKKQSDSLEKINKMAEDIGIITKMITNISEQTNLLALNASIEAGRAGEQGLGFSVVAEKVQKLAEESKNSVEKTAEIVEKITREIGETTSDSLDISRAMEEISTAAEEQTASMEEISATSGILGEEVDSLKEQLSIFEK